MLIFRGPLALKPGASRENRVGDAPAGRVEPVSGFGLIWRGEVEGAENVRQLVGWAVEPEYPFDAAYQEMIAVGPYWRA